MFEKSGNFSQNEHRDTFDPSPLPPPLVCFHLLFKGPPLTCTTNTGFSTGVENIRGDGLSQYIGVAWEVGLKLC